jgi:lysophospholipase L1-like esterase
VTSATRSKFLRWALHGGLLVLSTAVALLLGEGLARLVLNPGDYLMARPVRDAVLGRRLAPGAAGHDAWGFRNPEVPTRGDVVTIGDSQTYGVGVPRLEAWPAQLSQLTGRDVYNAALPGYSPIQYRELLRRYALRLRPRVVVVGFYYGNDLLEAYRIVYALPHYTDLRRHDVPPVKRQPPSTGGTSPRWRRLQRWLARHSVLYDASLAAILRGHAQRAELIVRESGTDRPRIHQGTFSTVFTPGYRLRAVDLGSPVIREGLRLTLLQFQLMARLCDSAGVRLFVALIPTKERVYQPLVETDPGLRDHAVLREELAQEGEADRRVRGFLKQHGIAYVDLLPSLRAALGHTAIYPPDDDGHPNAAGHAAIARAVGRAIIGP